MPEIEVDGLLFRFPDGWRVEKYDDWKFYRGKRGFMNVFAGGICAGEKRSVKAADLLAVDPDNNLWIIEAKYYRDKIDGYPNPSELGDAVVQKVFDTLAALLPAKVNADRTEEREMAKLALGASGLRVVLHLEQPAGRPINASNVAFKLRQRLRLVDTDPLVVCAGAGGEVSGLEWRVEKRV